MKEHTIKINVCLDVEKPNKSSTAYNKSLKETSLPNSIIADESIHKSGLNDAKSLKPTTQNDFASISSSSFSSAKCSLGHSSDMQNINFFNCGKEKGNDD